MNGHLSRVLLDAIIEASRRNQFIISTHSSTVLTKLGAEPGSIVLHVSSDGERLPTSTVEAVTGPSGRLGVLSDLGYGFADLDLGEGWLIFEESSAQRIVQQFLVPWFAPNVSRLRIIGPTGDSRVTPLLLDFKEMFLFAHLEDAYKGRAWAIVDGGPAGADIVDRLRKSFPTWPPDRFSQWRENDFEQYYPAEFTDDVAVALSELDRRKKKQLKADLLNKVVAWVLEDIDRARVAFEASAAEVISKLREIEAEVLRLDFGRGTTLAPVPDKPSDL